VLLLFLARTGARVLEALNVDAADLQLDRPHPQALLRGKDRKQRTVSLPDDLALRHWRDLCENVGSLGITTFRSSSVRMDSGSRASAQRTSSDAL
jgi:integrase